MPNVHRCPWTCCRPSPRPARLNRPRGATSLETPRCASTTSLRTHPQGRRRRFDDDEPDRPAPSRVRHLTDLDERGAGVDDDGPPTATAGPPGTAPSTAPGPGRGWVITDHAAVDTELGVLKTGKEADVHLLERAVPDTGRARAAWRPSATAAPSTGCSTATPATSRAAGSAAPARCGRWPPHGVRPRPARRASGPPPSSRALARLWADGVPVPYPVQLDGTELLLEFIGTDDGTGRPAPGPAPSGPGRSWPTCGASSSTPCAGWPGHGLAHGDLSAFNLLVARGAGWSLIDLPQVVDVVGNPQGPAFLARDVRRIADWFAARGLPAAADAAGRAARRAARGPAHSPGMPLRHDSHVREGHTDRR